MAHGLKLAIVYNSELLKYCVVLAFVVTSKFVVFCYFLSLLYLFNYTYNSLHFMWNDNERMSN